MNDDDLHALIGRLEAALTDEVAAVLAAVYAEYAAGLDDATELVAARFSVGSIRGMWQRRVPGLLRRLLGISEQAATVAADDAGEPLPDGWDDLPGRYDDDTLPAQLADYVQATEQLLNAVGDRLAEAATAALADGLNAGETVEELRARLRDVFTRDGAQLGPGRAERIAQTEATRAWNAATLGAAQAMTGPDRPLVKQWIPRRDDRVRPAHADAAGQLQLLDEPFTVGGLPMQYPGDPAAPPDTTINCRCVMRLQAAERTAAMTDTPGAEGFQSRMPEKLKRYWLTGPGAARIRWGTPGDFGRCVRELRDKFPEDTEGLCANLHHEATGKWPGGDNGGDTDSYEVNDMEDEPLSDPTTPFTPDEPPTLATWSTPDQTALAFEDQETGDGRVFAPGALTWTGGPWPLQYADEMQGGHDGARLAGAIADMTRQGGRIAGHGVLYLTTSAGVEAGMLLAQGAPLGVSVDLDDVDIQLVEKTGDGPTDEDWVEPYQAHLLTASVLPLADGGWVITGETVTEWTASGTSLAGESRRITFHTDADGSIPADAFEITAAAGDPDTGGVVVEEQKAGQYVMRITRARVRGATLVSIPAYADARIVLDQPELFASADTDTATASAAGTDYERVIRYVRKSLTPVTAADAARFLKLPVEVVRRYLAKAAKSGEIVRLTRGSYVAANEEASATAAATPSVDESWLGEALTASASGAVDLPVAPRDTAWDGDAAMQRVFDWADGDGGKIGQAFAYHEDGADPTLKGSWKLGYADVLDDELTIVPNGVSAALGALNGARGGVDIPQDQTDAVRAKLEAVAAHVDSVLGEGTSDEMEASAWTAMRDLPPMPAAWFREPTIEELPPGAPGVNYSNGRIFGWVAQAGEPHAGYAKKITIDGLGRIDTTHFLRQRFTLDDGSTVKAGAFTMNAGHHADGAECETAACQFDDSRFVAGIVTVGMNERGMWFSGAAAPWLSEWDRSVFMSCQPSYHLKKGGNGQWQLRAVLSVPVPGHSSPLLASAVAERSQLALTAAAAIAETEPQHDRADTPPVETAPHGVADPVEALTAALLAPTFLDRFSAALASRELDRERERAELAALMAEAEAIGETIAASAYPDNQTITNEGN